eukprot:9149656-Lingulodinium_polyedra.AAC.1
MQSPPVDAGIGPHERRDGPVFGGVVRHNERAANLQAASMSGHAPGAHQLHELRGHRLLDERGGRRPPSRCRPAGAAPAAAAGGPVRPGPHAR